MQSMWSQTIKTGDIIKLPQNCYMWTEGEIAKTNRPTYGLLVEKEFDQQYCKIMVDGKYYYTYNDNIYPGSENG